MIPAIVARLKTGVIKNVVAYGYSLQMPEPPYVVVKPEPDVAGRGRSIRIIVHMLPGQNIMLEDYVMNDLSLLLSDFPILSRHGNRNMLLLEQEYTDIMPHNDDETISMERVFLIPSRLF